MSYINNYYIKKIKEFHNKFLPKYCDEQNIETSFDTFLNYKKNAFTSETFKYLSRVPIVYLACSRAFRKYYNTLDPDFQHDIATMEELKASKQTVHINKELKDFLKGIMNKDFCI